MTLVTDLDLPPINPADGTLHGSAFHRAIADLRAEFWPAAAPFGLAVLDREAVEFFIRTPTATFPGVQMVELFGVMDGPLHNSLSRNLLNLSGDSHRRLRNPGESVRTDRRRPVAPGDARNPRAAVGAHRVAGAV